MAAFNKANDGIVKAMEAGDAAAAERIAANYVKINNGINAKYADKVQRTPRVRVPKDNSDRARQQALDELRQEVQWQGKLDDATKAYQNGLDDMLATRKQQIALQVESVGMGQKEFAQKKELLQIDSEYNRQLASLNKSYEHEATTLAANGQLDRLAEAKKAYEAQKDALTKHYKDQTDATKQGFVDIDAAQGNGLKGMQAAMQDFIDT